MKVYDPKKGTNQAEEHQTRKHTHIQEAEGLKIQKIKIYFNKKYFPTDKEKRVTNTKPSKINSVLIS